MKCFIFNLLTMLFQHMNLDHLEVHMFLIVLFHTMNAIIFFFTFTYTIMIAKKYPIPSSLNDTELDGEVVLWKNGEDIVFN